MTNYSYIGSELELFSEARNWKAYYRQSIKKYLGAEVLEVGAGIGSTTEFLCRGNHQRWLCLEPDPQLAKTLNSYIASGNLPNCCELKVGTILELSHKERFDNIIYIDVLEHIKDDRLEIENVYIHLKEGGFLVVLAPAHQWLFTPFDEAIGHYRRYNKKMLEAIILSDQFKCISLRYLDCVGLIASLGNRLLLKSKMPNKQQILLWDKVMVPISKIVDPLIQYSVGKSILGIWQKR
ncbi:MAG TPA: methyltransferase type 12 [Cyanobacteria bacterium UBA11049]|nr:methyltransferase type 12 [Cyanobacteria bacterium UBA11049]